LVHGRRGCYGVTADGSGWGFTQKAGSAVDRIRDQLADLEHHRSPMVLDFKAIVEAKDQLLVPEQKSLTR